MAKKLILANKYKIVFLYIVSIDKGVKDPFLTPLSIEMLHFSNLLIQIGDKFICRF